MAIPTSSSIPDVTEEDEKIQETPFPMEKFVVPPFPAETFRFPEPPRGWVGYSNEQVSAMKPHYLGLARQQYNHLGTRCTDYISQLTLYFKAQQKSIEKKAVEDYISKQGGRQGKASDGTYHAITEAINDEVVYWYDATVKWFLMPILLLVTIVGRFGTGKTFLMNRLTGGSCPESHSHSTRGLSFMSAQPRFEFAFCDTFGCAGPFEVQSLSQMIKMDGLDSLLHQIAFDIADVLILVVDRMGSQDLKYLADIWKENKKTVIMVHNYQSISSKKDLQDAFQVGVLAYLPHTHCFSHKNSEGKIIGQSWNTTFDDDSIPSSPKTLSLVHVLLGREGTEAGEDNPAAFAIIHNHLNSLASCNPKKLLEESIQNSLKGNGLNQRSIKFVKKPMTPCSDIPSPAQCSSVPDSSNQHNDAIPNPSSFLQKDNDHVDHPPVAVSESKQ